MDQAGGIRRINWRVTFDPVTNPAGDLPTLSADPSGLTGTDAAARVYEARPGSLDRVVRPINGEYLRVPTRRPDTVRLSVAGIPASCAESASDSCGFALSTESTPALLSAVPAAATPGMQITLLGTGLLPDESDATDGKIPAERLPQVTVGGAPCEVTGATSDSITCLPDVEGPAGAQLVAVRVPGKGFASHPEEGVVTFRLRNLVVTAAFPGVVATAGATLLTITGAGFATEDCAGNAIVLEVKTKMLISMLKWADR